MDTPGVLFDRDAWVGIENETIGKLTFGRQNAIARDPAMSKGSSETLSLAYKGGPFNLAGFATSANVAGMRCAFSPRSESSTRRCTKVALAEVMVFFVVPWSFWP